MAGGDLGDLKFSLGIQDNVSKELNNIITKFVNMDISVNKATDSIRKLSARLREVKDSDDGGPSKEMLKMANAVDGTVMRIVRLRSEIRKTSEAINQIKSIPNFMKDANLMSSLNKLQGYLRTLNSIDGSKLIDGNRIQAIFSNGARSIQEANISLKAYKETAIQSQRAVEANARAARDLASSFRQAHDAASKTSGVMNDMKSLLLQGGIVYGAQQFVTNIIHTGGEIEKQHIALQSIIGDLQNANELFGQIKNLALESPFTFSELNRDVKQLAAFGVETDSLYDKTKRIADISAGLGVSFERLGLAYGQIKSRSWLDGKELRQLAYAGLPMLQKLADMYTRERGKAFSTRDVREMITKREVSFEDVDKIFNELTNKGGQFYQMQNTLSETLLGRYLKLKDAWEIMLSGFARGDSIVGGTMKNILNSVTALIQGFDKLGPVILAAFSGVALKKASFALGGSISSSILSAKGSLAAKYQEKAITGQLEASERRILATKHLITTEDLKALAASGAITNKEAQRLLLANRITASQYAQLGVITGSSVKINAMTVRMRALNMLVANGGASAWQSFALRGLAAINMVAGGIKSIGLSIWSAIGGLPGLILTGVTMGLVHLWQKSEELKQAQRQASEELANRSKQLKEFLADNDVRIAIDNGGQELINSIDAYKEKLKELAPYNYEAYVMQMEEKASHEERLKYLRKELELLKEANTVSTRKSDKFIDNFGGRFEDIGDNIKGLQQSVDDSGKNQMAKQMFKEYRRSIDSTIKDIAEDILKEFPDIATNPKTQEAFKQLRVNLYAAKNFSPDQQMYVDIKLDELLHIKDDSRFKTMVQDKLLSVVNESKIILSNGVEETGAMLAEKIKYGQKLTDAEKKKLDELLHTAISKLKADFPEYASNLQTLLNNANFVASVKLNFVGEKPTGLQKQIYNNFPLISNPNVRNLGTSWMGENQSIDEAVNKGKQEINKRLNEFLSRKNAFVKGKITKDELNKSEIDYNDSVSALQLGYGVTYKGENTGLNKKFQQQQEKAKRAAEKAKRDAERAAEKARREEERRQREILRTWQRRKKLLEEYYETWEKWRKIEGREDAKTRLRNDKNFKSISSTFKNPENLAENLERLVNGYSKLAKTEDQRNFLAETRAEASKKEADIEYKNASDRVEMLNEQLDLLSKQYDLYQKLSKVTSSSVATEFSFGSYGVYRKDKGSYYGYLRDKLNSLQGNKLSPKDFVNNEMPASERSKKSLEEVRVTAGIKKVNFGPDGLEGVLKLTDNQIKDRFGQEISKILIDFKKETDKLDEKIADSLVHGFEYLQNYQAEIDSINQSYDEQIERLEKRNQLEEDNVKYISDEALRKGKILLEQQRNRDISNVNLEAAKHSASYYNFFGAITTLSTDEAEKYGATIRDIVNKAFQNGAIDAREYTKQMKQINDQMEKLHNSQSDFITYLQGGLDAVIQKYKEQGDEMQNRSSNDYEQASKYFQNAKLNGDTSGMQIAQNQMNNAKIMGQQGEAISKMAGGMKGTVSMIDAIVNGINNAVQSMKKFVDQLADDFDTLGKGGDGIRDSKGYQFVSGFSEASQGAADGWNSLKSGNVMGAVTGVYRSFAGWFTGTARARDAKLDRQIQLAERKLKALSNLQSSIERNLKKTLGGVYGYKADADDVKKLKEGLDNYSMAKRGIEYGHDTRLASKAIGAGAGIAVGAGSAALSGALLGSAVGPIGAAVGAVAGAIVGFIVGGLFGHKKKKHTTVYSEETNTAMEKAYRTQTYYDQQFAVMNMQLDQTNAKLEKEKSKKKKDESKIEDYESQVAELNSQIKTFAMDMAKSIYDIDLKSWAKELTNAIVDAWSKGEDAAKAYHDKVRDLMKTLTTNILTQKVMEAMLGNTEKLIKKKMTDKSGKLDENDILDLADIIEKDGKSAIENITKVFEVLKSKGMDLTQNGSSSIGNGIKSITEETSDLLASYVNSIRSDVSVGRENMQRIADAMASMPQMSDIANSQLAELRIISVNTQKSAENTERILMMFREITTPGLKKVNIH